MTDGARFTWVISATLIAACLGAILLRETPPKKEVMLRDVDPTDLPSVARAQQVMVERPARWVLEIDGTGALHWKGNAIPSADRRLGLQEGLRLVAAQMKAKGFLSPSGLLRHGMYLEAHRGALGREVIEFLRECNDPGVRVWNIWVLVSGSDGRLARFSASLSGKQHDWDTEGQSGCADVTLRIEDGVAEIRSETGAVVETPMQTGIIRVNRDATVRLRIDPGETATWGEVVDLLEVLDVGIDRPIWLAGTPIHLSMYQGQRPGR